MKKVSVLLLSVICITAVAQNKNYKLHTIAFYNLENLFDTIDDPNIDDQEYLPENGWNLEKYNQKLKNLERVISDIGTSDHQNNSPTILGVCEIENRIVLEDLVAMPELARRDYGIIHFDSPDGRGIDVGLLYQKAHFKPNNYINIPLKTKRLDDSNKWLKTRDQLLVSGLLDNEEIHIIVNHWPSRSGGEKRSSLYREAAGTLNKKIIDSLRAINPEAKIISMGDLNDGPFNNSLKKSIGTVGEKSLLKTSGMFNPMEKMSKKGMGSLAWRDAWDLFDQIILSETLVRENYKSWNFWRAGIFIKPYLINQTGQFKGYPLRNNNGETGFSDHFPVYLYLLKEHDN